FYLSTPLTTVSSQPSSSSSNSINETKSDSSSTTVKSIPGDNHDDLKHIELKFNNKTSDEQSIATSQKSPI
ncbi:unnamed protein product, partial [Rotaria magnacalcarata]